MGVSKERKLFLKWRNDHYPLLKSEHSESNFLWQAWQGRAAEGGNISERSCIKRKIETFNEIIMKTTPFEFRVWHINKMFFGSEATDYLSLTIKGVFKSSDLFIMLSTGLTDRRGKKIFQYDIIDQGDNFNSVVMYGKTECTVGFFIQETHKKTGECWPREHELYAYTTIPDETEILGNVFETPKLAGTWWKKPRKF